MKVLEVKNAQEALLKGMKLLSSEGVRRQSRAGDVLVLNEPVTTVYEKPTERVLFWAERDANPFFHFMEGLWMLSGRNDVAWISQFSSGISRFSDDGISFHGAYGYRWVNHFVQKADEDLYLPFNQLSVIADMLRNNPDERRCVLQMWDPESDLGHKGKDVPCNTEIFFKIGLDGRLNMTVINRSNDIIWGAYGANVVHMSMLQEFLAAWVGVSVGRYWQVSNDWHGYVDVYDKHKEVMEAEPYNPYTEGEVEPYQMVNSPVGKWVEELLVFIEEGPVLGFQDRFFRRVASPIWKSWFAWRLTEGTVKERVEAALEEISHCKASDWRKACEEWLTRRVK